MKDNLDKEMQLFDTHAHLQLEAFDGDRGEVIKRAGEAGVGVINMGTDLASSAEGLKLAQSHVTIHAGIGIHPHKADSFSEQILEKLKEMAQSDEALAIGEIGLDYYRENSARDGQRKAFRAQLKLALELDLPVSIHNRSSSEDLLAIMEELEEIPRGVAHSFFGDLPLAERLMDLGLYLGISGPVTFDNSEDLVKIVNKLPLERLLLETDCPYMTPVPHRGERNEPLYVRHIARKVAQIKGIALNEVAEKTSSNARELFDR